MKLYSEESSVVGRPFRFQAQEQQQPQQPKKRGFSWGSFALSLLPGGSLLDKKMHHENITGGDVATEAALSLVPFGIGKLAKGAKVARAGVDAFKATKEVSAINEARRAAQAAIKNSDYNVLQRTGFKLSGKVRGLKPGVKVSGLPSELTPQRADELNNFLTTTVGTNARTPEKQFRQLINFKNKAVTELNSHIDKNNLKITGKDLGELKRNILFDIGDTPDISPNDPLVKTMMGRLTKVKDIKGLEKARKNFQEVVNYGRSNATVDPARERIAETVRRHIDKMVTEKLPSSKELKGLVSNSYDAEKFLAKASNREGILNSGRGGGLGGAAIGAAQEATNPLFAKTGAALTRFGGDTNKAKAARFLASQGGLRMAADATGVRDPGFSYLPESAGQVPPDMQAPDLAGGTDMGMGTGTDTGAGAYDTSLEQSLGLPTADTSGAGMGGEMSAGGFDPQQFVLDNIGNVKDASDLAKLISTAQSMGELFNPQSKMSANSQKTMMQSTQALSVLDSIQRAFQHAGGAQGAAGGTVANIGGKLRLNQNARYYNDIARGQLARIIRGLGEVGTLSDSDVQRAINLMPNLADTQENAGLKFQELRTLFGQSIANAQGFPNTASEMPTSSLDLAGSMSAGQ